MAVHRNVLQEDDILCELYADTRCDVSDYSDNKSLDSDSEVPTTSSRKQLRSSTGPLTPIISTPIFPHIYKDSFHSSVRLSQTLLDRNVRVCGTMKANRGIPCHLEGEVSVLEEW